MLFSPQCSLSKSSQVAKGHTPLARFGMYLRILPY